MTSSSSSRLSTGGTKPAPIPWMRCGPGGAPESTADAFGSTATTRRRGLTCSRRYSPVPVIVPPGADAGHEHVDVVVERPRDLGSGGAAVGLRVGGVGELVGQEHVGALGHRARGLDRLVHAPHRLGDVHAGPVQAQQALALAAHPLRQLQHQVIALGGAHERERDPGVAAGGLDDRGAPRLDPPFGLGGLDHRDADAVLDAAARVEAPRAWRTAARRSRRRGPPAARAATRAGCPRPARQC